VALARAVARALRVMLMDEPFSRPSTTDCAGRQSRDENAEHPSKTKALPVLLVIKRTEPDEAMRTVADQIAADARGSGSCSKVRPTMVYKNARNQTRAAAGPFLAKSNNSLAARSTGRDRHAVWPISWHRGCPTAPEVEILIRSAAHRIDFGT